MKDYRSTHLVPYEEPRRLGFITLDVLPFLCGRLWDEYALAVVHALRPSCIRVTTGEVKCDSLNWRVTVYVDDEGLIWKLTQEVVIGLPDDWRHGSDALRWIHV